LIATDAAVAPNTDGTNETEPSTRFLRSQSLTPFSPPGHTQRKAPSSYASACGAIGDSSEYTAHTPVCCVQSRSCLRRRFRRRSRANGSTRVSDRSAMRTIVGSSRAAAPIADTRRSRSRTHVAIRCIFAAMLSIASMMTSGSGTSSRADVSAL